MKKLFVCLLAACLVGLTSCSEDMAKDLLRSALGDILETGTETTETDPNALDATETEKEPEKETEIETEKETEKEQTQEEVVIVCELESINLRAMPLGLF